MGQLTQSAVHEEGYIKFDARWEQTPPLVGVYPKELLDWRNRLFVHGLIGMLPDGIGYGNVSERLRGDTFLITGSATGGVSELTTEHLAMVEDADASANTVICKGPVVASSESMSHDAIYRATPAIRAVMHIHHLGMWRYWKGRLPTTPDEARYGTPQMATALLECARPLAVQSYGLIVMGGHREGLIAFGPSHEIAGRCLMAHYDAIPEKFTLQGAGYVEGPSDGENPDAC